MLFTADSRFLVRCFVSCAMKRKPSCRAILNDQNGCFPYLHWKLLSDCLFPFQAPPGIPISHHQTWEGGEVMRRKAAAFFMGIPRFF